MTSRRRPSFFQFSTILSPSSSNSSSVGVPSLTTERNNCLQINCCCCHCSVHANKSHACKYSMTAVLVIIFNSFDLIFHLKTKKRIKVT